MKHIETRWANTSDRCQEDPMPKYYTPEEVAQELRVTRRTVYEWLTTGRLRGMRAGNRWRVDVQDLETFIQPGGSGRAGDEAAEHATREARVMAIVGKYADVPFSSDDLMREKHERWQREQQELAASMEGKRETVAG
jgi:excisionase family DNA binding protein